MTSPKYHRTSLVGLDLKSAERQEKLAIHKLELIQPLTQELAAKDRKKHFSNQTNIGNLISVAKYYVNTNKYFDTSGLTFQQTLQNVSFNYHKCTADIKNSVTKDVHEAMDKQNTPVIQFLTIFNLSRRGKRIWEVKDMFDNSKDCILKDLIKEPGNTSPSSDEFAQNSFSSDQPTNFLDSDRLIP